MVHVAQKIKFLQAQDRTQPTFHFDPREEHTFICFVGFHWAGPQYQRIASGHEPMSLVAVLTSFVIALITRKLQAEGNEHDDKRQREIIEPVQRTEPPREKWAQGPRPLRAAPVQDLQHLFP